MGVLSDDDVRRYLTPGEQLINEAAAYGIPIEHLAPNTGPSVAPLNGVVASHGVMEFQVMVTSMREPCQLLNYYGHRSVVTTSKDRPAVDCYYCKSVYGSRKSANLERYLLQFVH